MNKKWLGGAGVVVIACLILFMGLFMFKLEAVKNICPPGYPNVSYEKAFGEFFDNGRWSITEVRSEYMKIRFKGTCLYDARTVVVELTLVYSEASKAVEDIQLSLNGVPQNRFVLGGMLSVVFEPYEVIEPDQEEVPETQEEIPKAQEKTMTSHDVEGILAYPNVATKSKLNIRSGPGENYEVVEQVTNQDTVTLLEKKGEWYYLQTTGGNYGYALGQYISLEYQQNDFEYSDAPEGSAKADGEENDDFEYNPLGATKADSFHYEYLGLDAEGKEIYIDDLVALADGHGYSLEGIVVDKVDKQILVEWYGGSVYECEFYAEGCQAEHLDEEMINHLIGTREWRAGVELITWLP